MIRIVAGAVTLGIAFGSTPTMAEELPTSTTGTPVVLTKCSALPTAEGAFLQVVGGWTICRGENDLVIKVARIDDPELGRAVQFTTRAPVRDELGGYFTISMEPIPEIEE